MLASTHFGITRKSNDDWFDTILDVDTALFVDPFLIFKDTESFWATAHDTLISHFDEAFTLIAEGLLNRNSLQYRKAVELLIFHEPRELCLGYTALGTRGAGSSRGFASDMAEAITEAIRRGLSAPSHFEELGILRSGIGPDRISDATCTILKAQLIAYTQTVAERHNISLSNHQLYGAEFDTQRKRFRTKTVRVPTNPVTNGPLLFVPERFLDDLPTLSPGSWWKYYEAEQLREDLNYEVMSKVNKDVIVSTARQHTESVRKWAQSEEDEPATPYDLERDRKGVVQWEPAATEFTTENPLVIGPPANEDEFKSVIEKVIDRFRLYIEEQGGWRLLWDEGKEKEELAAQLLFYGIARCYCEANNVVVSREVELGRGPVDFTFSNGFKHRAHLEVKKLNNGKFWNGLDRQLPSYMVSDGVQMGWFIAIRYRDGKKWDTRAAELPARVSAAADAHGIELKASLVDARPKASASRL
ncbi:MAG TPA: hypothetical protein VL989_02210 [Candidatus Sulfotelmatobacter sp.]|nr:hypothetical protein [Candidatus Sulfotelmatobacter sp.]